MHCNCPYGSPIHTKHSSLDFDFDIPARVQILKTPATRGRMLLHCSLHIAQIQEVSVQTQNLRFDQHLPAREVCSLQTACTNNDLPTSSSPHKSNCGAKSRSPWRPQHSQNYLQQSIQFALHSTRCCLKVCSCTYHRWQQTCPRPRNLLRSLPDPIPRSSSRTSHSTPPSS